VMLRPARDYAGGDVLLSQSAGVDCARRVTVSPPSGAERVGCRRPVIARRAHQRRYWILRIVVVSFIRHVRE